MRILDVAVAVPRLTGAVPGLHKPNAPLYQSSRDQQLAILNPLTVKLEEMLRLALHIERFGRLGLHSKRHLE